MRKLIIVSILIIVAAIIPILKISAAESMHIIGDVSSIRNGTAQIEIQSGTTSKQLIIAGYNNKVLKAITTITIESGEGNKLVDIPPFSNDVTTVKFFLWNSLHKISPLISSLTYNLPEISDESVIRITAEDIESGGYVYGSKSENSKRLRVNRLIPVTKGSVVTFYLNSQQIYIYEVDKAGATTSQKSMVGILFLEHTQLHMMVILQLFWQTELIRAITSLLKIMTHKFQLCKHHNP